MIPAHKRQRSFRAFNKGACSFIALIKKDKKFGIRKLYIWYNRLQSQMLGHLFTTDIAYFQSVIVLLVM